MAKSKREKKILKSGLLAPQPLTTSGGTIPEAKRKLKTGGVEALALYAAANGWPTRFRQYQDGQPADWIQA